MGLISNAAKFTERGRISLILNKDEDQDQTDYHRYGQRNDCGADERRFCAI
jgi:hypothetical protein